MDASKDDVANANANNNTQQGAVHGKTDPAWEHVAFRKEGKTNCYTCLHCGTEYRGGGINRMKQHLARLPGNISYCRKVPEDVSHRMNVALESIQAKKNNVEVNEAYNGPTQSDVIETNESSPLNSSLPPTQQKGKRKATADIGDFFAPRTTPGSQPTLKSVWTSKEAVHKAHMAIARWLYDACIPFNATQSPYFQAAADAIVAIGPGFKVPSYHEVRVNLLEDCKKECQLLVDTYRASWAKRGCTIMADGWSDQRQRTLINFLVYCPDGMTFVKSVDASNVVKDAGTLCNLFSEVIDWVGPANVVHVVTDNAPLIMLLLDIGSMPHIADLASKASKVTIFVYNHVVFLSWLRKRDGWKEIVRPGVTRFATVFLTLKSIHDHKSHLQALVLHSHFTSHRLSKSAAGKAVSAIILDNRFWDQCFLITNLVAPLIRLLRIVDGDEKPSMGYVYEGMQRATNAIKTMLQKKKDLYKPYTEIIKARWDRHLKRDLHAAAYFLNPAFSYDEKYQEKNRVVQALLKIFNINSFNIDLTKAIQEMQLYRERKGSFESNGANKVAKTIQADQWWVCYGGDAPILQKLAIRLLGQTSSSSGCERNWSVFERIHTKRRNRLEHKRLNDLVYVTYNLRLKNRLVHNKKAYDPIDYESIDNLDFWVAEEEETTPEFDADDIDDFLFTHNSTPVVGQTSRTNGGENVGSYGGAASGAYEDPNISAYDGVDLSDCYDL
ncbi:uncharacterized protein LOC130744326 [Lotus japonicus]|uniref:uncharacterized protein LOC130744326 n=1 Tax=Lotus japonicus TaxID=34305 RepID=UPI0025895F93|nr:uncharacterized protein LOC130744326 [Lotus japonicus]